MASHVRVLNLSTGKTHKRSQARGWVEQCLCAWVEMGFTIRDLSPAERIRARAEQSRIREPLPFAEIPGIVFRFEDQAATRQESQLAAQANRFVEQAA